MTMTMTMTARRARTGSVLAALLGVLAAGCGLPVDKEPRAFDTVAPRESTTTPTTVVAAGPTDPTTSLFFVGKVRLKLASRPEEGDPPVGDVLRILLAGPTKEELRRQLSTAIPAETRLLGSELSNTGVLTINLSPEINQIEGANQKLAYGQLVLTAVNRSEVRSVRFEVEGKPVAVPTDSGNIDRVDPSNFGSIAPA
jgi:Sporulation and spore germination